ncbi:ATP-binding cassette domain-containing protein [Clostridium sp.]|uniref:ATP-binding cassette domain-containing protein n=1 Tax=Clostridium sp. TaxID=1506 RepID=UPI002FC762AA
MDNFIFQIKDLKSSNSIGDTINGIDLDLKPNEVLALVGDNDSITRTFTQAVSGQEKNVKGRVIFKGVELDISQIDKIHGVSFLLQKSLLVKTLSVAENISLDNMPTLGFLPLVNWRKVKKNAKDLLEKFNFEVNYKATVSKLSDEERKLVSIAKAFSNNSDFIVLHNPTEGLSSESVQKLYQMIQNYKVDGKSIIYVTKVWEEALKVADRISVVSEGKTKKTFMSEEAKKNPQELLNILGRYNRKDNQEKIDSENEEVLDAVFRAAEFLTSEYELNDVLSLLSKQVTKFMNADGCTIHLIDEGTNTIIDTLEFKIKEELHAKLKKEIILSIVEKGKLYYTNQNNKDFPSIFEHNNKVKTIICVPVLIRSRVTGIVQIFYEEFYAQSKEETKYLSAFARHAALAIEDTRLMGRSALLQESHHRIKNNLQGIINIISLQKQVSETEVEHKLNEVLDNTISRIKSIAAVHDLLSKDKLGRSIINIKDIVEIVAKYSSAMNKKLKIELELDDIFIPYNKATSIALIINELISNCIKHAFPSDGKGIIDIKCQKYKDYILLSVEDDGVGITPEFDIDNMNSLGVSIVSSIIKYEFKGNIEFILKAKGTKVKIKLPNEKVFVTYMKRNESI